MKSYFVLILTIFSFFQNFGQDFQMPNMPTKELERGGNLQNSSIADSLLSNFGDKSTKLNKNPDAKIEDYLLITRQYDTLRIDTSLTINKYHKINFLRKDNFGLMPFSNTGVAYNSLVFEPSNSISPKIGASNKYFAYDSADDVVYYDLPTPFTELMYRSVFEQGQLLDAIYSVNTSRQFNFSISRKGLRSLGNYQNFISSSSNFKFTTSYKSRNKRFRLRTHYNKQNLFSEQNGGIRDSDVPNFENGIDQFLDRGVFDLNFENASNDFISKRFYIDQFYVLKESDSIKNYSIELSNSIYFEEKNYRFNQSSSDDFFGDYFISQEIRDELFLNTMNFQSKLLVSSKNLGNINLGLIYIDDQYSLENYQIDEYIDNSVKIDAKTVYLNTGLEKSFSNIDLNLKLINYIHGDNKSNLFQSKINFHLKEENYLAFQYSFTSTPPNYNQILHRSNYEAYNWTNQFKNPITNSLAFSLRLSKIFDLDLEYMSVKNHIQFHKLPLDDLDSTIDYSIVPLQYGADDLNLLKINLARKIKLGKFSFDTRILIQRLLENEIINLPELVTRNTLFYSTDMFNKALFLQTGFGFSYFSKYFMNGYDPLLSELYIQNDKMIGGFPLIDFFVNAKIQQTRLYFKFEHLNSSFTGYKYYSAPNYPYRDFTFRFGLVWNFFM